MTEIDPNGSYDPELQGNFDFEDMVVVLDTGEHVPITNLLRGEETVTDPVDAWALVAGPTLRGEWMTFAVTDEDLRRAGLIK